MTWLKQNWFKIKERESKNNDIKIRYSWFSLILGVISFFLHEAFIFLLIPGLAILFGIFGLRTKDKKKAVMGLILGSIFMAVGLISPIIYENEKLKLQICEQSAEELKKFVNDRVEYIKNCVKNKDNWR